MKAKASVIYLIFSILVFVSIISYGSIRLYQSRVNNQASMGVTFQTAKILSETSFLTHGDFSAESFSRSVSAMYEEDPNLQALVLYSIHEGTYFISQRKPGYIRTAQPLELRGDAMPVLSYMQIIEARKGARLSIPNTNEYSINIIYSLLPRDTIFSILFQCLAALLVFLIITTVFMIITTGKKKATTAKTSYKSIFSESSGSKSEVPQFSNRKPRDEQTDTEEVPRPAFTPMQSFTDENEEEKPLYDTLSEEEPEFYIGNSEKNTAREGTADSSEDEIQEQQALHISSESVVVTDNESDKDPSQTKSDEIINETVEAPAQQPAVEPETNETDTTETEKTTEAPAPCLFNPQTGLGYEQYLAPRLNFELERAASFDQDLVLLLCRIPGLSEDHAVFNVVAKQMLQWFAFQDLSFEYGDEGFAVILPNMDLSHGLREAENYERKFATLQNKYENLVLEIGLSSRNGRILSGPRLEKEANSALERTSPEKENRVVAFRSDPGKYRKYLATGLS
ncbi:MAG: diguanylate cyclase domain-containing protein [Spirochaetia bacterium]